MTNALVAELEREFQVARDMDGSLRERLDYIAGRVRALSPSFAATVDGLVARLQQAGVGSTSPAPGDPMPPFMLPDDTGKLVSLDDLLRKGPAAIVFHRGYWCPYCRLNNDALAKAQAEVAKEGGQIIAITPDRQHFALKLKSEASAAFPILVDMDNGYSLSLNLAFWVGEEMSKFMSAAGYLPPESQGNDAWMLPIPATFIVGTDGIVKARFVDPDYRKRMEVEDLLSALRSAGSGGSAATSRLRAAN